MLVTKLHRAASSCRMAKSLGREPCRPSTHGRGTEEREEGEEGRGKGLGKGNEALQAGEGGKRGKRRVEGVGGKG